jgi:hypothetical protein
MTERERDILLKIKKITQEFAICKVSDISKINFSDEFCFVEKTDAELSLVCTAEHVPQDTVECHSGWRAFRIEGTLDFSLIGILAKISALLADQGIGIFVVSTYNTDYVLTRTDDYENALSALQSEGYEIVS